MPNTTRKSKPSRWALYTNSLGNYFFDEIRELIAAGLKELGHAVELRDDTAGFAKNADWHLVIAPHEFYQLGAGGKLARQNGPRNLILFNTEQPSTQWFALSARHFPRAAAIWDIDYESSLRIAKSGYPCSFLPLGYAAPASMFQEITRLPRHEGTSGLAPEVLTRSYFAEPLVRRPIDVLFLGHSSPRREKFFNRHAESLGRFKNYFHKSNIARPLIPGQTTNMNTATSIGLAQRSRILLNVHHGVDVYFEWHRIVLLGIAQRALVVTEPCSLAPPFRANVDFVEAPLNELPERIEYYLASDSGKQEAQSMADRAFHTLTSGCRISELLRPLVARLTDASAPEPGIGFFGERSAPSASPAPAARAKRPLSICVVTHDVNRDGREAESGAGQVALAETLASAGHDVTLLHAQDAYGRGRTIGSWTQHFLARGIRYVALPSDISAPLDAPHTMARAFEVYRWLRREKFQVVHFPEGQGIGFYSLLAKHQGLGLAETLLLVRAHGPGAWWRQGRQEFLNQVSELEIDFMERECLRLADGLTTPTRFMSDWLKRQSWPVPAAPAVLPNPGPAGRSATVDSSPVKEFVFVGAIETAAGLDLFCDAIERMDADLIKDLTVTLLGPVAMMKGRRSTAYLKERARKWPCAWQLFTDPQADEVRDYLQEPGRLAVLPPLMANSPFLVGQCLSLGVPFLASDVGGVGELIADDDRNRVLFAKSPAALAATLAGAIRNGIQPARAARDAAAVESAWIEWHDALSLPAKSDSPSLPANPPLVSVCLVHFNRPEFLRQAVASLETQDYPNFEVVLVDDGSNKPEAIAFLAGLEPSFKKKGWQLIRQENRYLGAARNTAARHARGEYLLFMDDDNYAKPEEISAFVRVALKTRADILTAAMDLFAGTEPPDLKRAPKSRWLFLGAATSVGVFRNCFGDANALIRRETFERIGGFTEDYGITHEDWEFHARAVLAGCRLETIPEALFWYRYTPGSMIHSTPVFANHQRSLRPYLAATPEPLRELLQFTQGQKFQIDELSGVVGDFQFTRRLLNSALKAARTLAGLNQSAAADRMFMEVLKCAEGMENHGLVLDALLITGKSLAELGRTELALKLLERALKLARRLRHSPSEALAEALIHAVNSGGDIAAACAGMDLPGSDLEDPDADKAAETVSSDTSFLTKLALPLAARRIGSVVTARPATPAKRLRRVGFLALEPHHFACPFLRLKSILEHLDKSGALEFVPLGEVRDGRFQLIEDSLKRIDVVVVQRQMAAALPYAELKQKLAGHDGKIVFEIDDALTILPPSHRAAKGFKKIQPRLEEYLRHADLVTVSTPQLRALYASFNDRITVLPNSLDPRVWSTVSPCPADSGKITILFSGTLDHERDLEIVEPALIDLLAAYPDWVEILYWGNVTPRLRALPQVRPAHEFTPDYRDYASRLQKLPVSFAIVPLEDSEFNRAKSPIKWLEYSACGIPGIYSDIAAYNLTVENGRTGLLVANTREAWFAALKSLVENPAFRQKLAAAARDEVQARHTIAQNAALWSQAYESLYAPRTEPVRPAAVPMVSIVIPVFNQGELTRRCLECVRSHTSSVTHEVIVVDNGSTDGTGEFLKAEEAAGRLRVIRNATNLGFAKACNQGARAAGARFILFLNNDTEVQPGWLAPLVSLAEADPRIAATGSKLLFPNGTIQHAGVAIGEVSGRDPLIAVHSFYNAAANLPAANQRRVYQALTAACLLVRKSSFEAVGGFDEGFWNGYEDVDLCLQFQERGWISVYEPASVVVHHESKSGPARFEKVQENIRRLHEKWLIKTKLDLILPPDGKVTPLDSTRIRPYEPPAAAAPLTSIIILAHNQLALTRACIDSIERHTPEPHELILVDNASADGTLDFFREVAARRENVSVIANNANRGFAAANNQALSVARGEFVLLLNNDTVVVPGWLEHMHAVFAAHPQTGIVGPRSNRVLGKQEVEKPSYRTLEELPAFAAGWVKEHAGQSRTANRVIGFCLLARRGVIEAIGGLDEQFGSGNFEDDDFCIRAGLAGFEIRIADASFVHHVGNATFNAAGIDYREAMLRNWELFKRKWEIPAGVPVQLGYLTPTALPSAVPLRAALPELQSTHELAANGRCWTDKGFQTSIISRVQDKPLPSLPACAKIGQLDEARELFRAKNFAAAWNATLKALEQRPFHPEACLQLAGIALAAGDSDVARQCARRARDLAPNWTAAKQFLKKPLTGSSRPDWLKLPEQIRNPLTVCVIAKDEEKFLGQCLASVKNLAQQIIVVDTGSTDRTIEIAKAHGAEVYSCEWRDDFSAARNVALEHASGDWILMLDADEELPAGQHAALEEDMDNAEAIALRLPLTNVGQEDGFSYVPRLFRNAPGVYYQGRIHEQVFPSLLPFCKAWVLETKLGTAQLLHHGYSKELVKDRNKIERNLRLLRLAVGEQPADANLLMNLGLELARSGQLSEGLDQYREAFRLMSALPAADVVPELREALLTQFTAHLYKVREHGEVVRVLESPLAKNGGLTASLHFAIGLAHFELKQFREAAEHMRRCLNQRGERALSPINTDINTSAPNHCLALSLAQLGDAAGAEKAFQAALKEPGRTDDVQLDYTKFIARQNPVDALHKLHEMVTQNAKQTAAWRLGGEIALKSPEFLEFACDWTGEAIRFVPDDEVIVTQRAEALLLSQQTAAAFPLWESVCDGKRPPLALAAWILCAAVEAQPLPMTNNAAEELAASKEFVGWYQRLIAVKAQETIVRLNAQVEALKKSLPTVAGMLESAMDEAKESATAT